MSEEDYKRVFTHLAKRVTEESASDRQERIMFEEIGMRNIISHVRRTRQVVTSALSMANRAVVMYENGVSFQSIMEDHHCYFLKEGLSEALCLLSEITPQQLERAKMAVYYSHILFRQDDMELMPGDLLDM